MCGWSIAGMTATQSLSAAWPPQEERRPAATSAQWQSAVAASEGGTSPTDAPIEREPKESSRITFSGLARDLAADQKAIWTSPARIRFVDANWLVPFAGVTAGLFITDRQVSGHLSQDPSKQQHYRKIANGGDFALVGVGGGLALWSTISHDPHQRESGFLAGEAAIDSFVTAEALKFALGRQRPFEGTGVGHFFSGGASFPSEHAAAAWSIAGVIAHEYPGKLPKLLAYGLATAVSVSRIRSRDHFPSDVVVGSGMGFVIGQYVYRKHHDAELGGKEWRSPQEWARDVGHEPGNLGSPNVPLDSWIYPVLDRLAAMGLIDSGFVGMRPWTRLECQRLLAEASEQLAGSDEENPEASQLLDTLEREFRPETEEAGGDGHGIFRLESLYSRTAHISGMPLNDGYHFAQTQINDFGRPYGEGWNTVNGFSAYGTTGPWTTYFRGEWQTAPSVPAFSLAARQTIQQVDFLPPQLLPPDSMQPSVNQFKVLDAYAGLTLSNWEMSFGKQSISWGAGEGGSLTLSTNAEPINMFRINRVTPLKLPSILGWLGPMRLEVFLGQLAGYEIMLTPEGYVGQFGQALTPQPFIHGEDISFKPTRNFEFGFYRTTIFGGPGYPFTLHSLVRSAFNTSNAIAGEPDKPGNRTSGLDFSYRLPHLRNWLTFYGDGYTDDQFSPIAYMDRSAWHAGMYLSHFPKLAKLDLRVEGVYTDVPGARGRLSIGPGSFYYNGTWRSGYTNNGELIGSWIGRGGQGAQAWTNYWMNARSRLQLNFRHQKVSQQFIPGGGTLTDFGGREDYWMRPSLGISASVQYERWLFPVIQPSGQTNVTASVEILFQPQEVFRRGNPREEDLNVGGRP
jgi:membrane-associated phospholipid phosphatase